MSNNIFHIVISGDKNSWSFFIGKKGRLFLVASLVLFFLTTVGAFISIYFMYDRDKNRMVELQKLVQDKVFLEKRYQDSVAASQELTEIEKKIGDLDSGENLTLAERVRFLARFYDMREQEFVSLDDKVNSLNQVFGSEIDFNSHNSEAAADLLIITAAQEKNLHANLPSGYPTESKIITSSYGNRIHPITRLKSFHKGVDLRAKKGSPVYATANGIVKFSGKNSLSGNIVRIMHNYGFETSYSHLNSREVKSGDIILKGDLLGHAGNTGRSHGSHLHYEVKYIGRALDPKPFVTWELGQHEVFNNIKGVKWESLITLINHQINHQELQLSLLEPRYLE